MRTLRRVIQAGLMAGSISLLPMASALADTTLESTSNACTGGTLNVCLGFSLVQLGTSTSQTYSLELAIQSINGSAPGAAGFSAFGLFNTTGTGTYTGVNACAAGSSCPDAGWSFTGCNDLNPQSTAICDNNNGDKAHDVEFTFTYTGSSSDLANADVAAHIQGLSLVGGGTCSVKTATDAQGGSSETGSSSFYTTVDAGCGAPVTSSPEPASLFLVGTGLLGLGGFGAARRRRRD